MLITNLFNKLPIHNVTEEGMQDVAQNVERTPTEWLRLFFQRKHFVDQCGQHSEGDIIRIHLQQKSPISQSIETQNYL